MRDTRHLEVGVPRLTTPGYEPTPVEIGSPVATLRSFASLDGPAIGVVVDYEETDADDAQVEVRWDHTDTASWWPATALRHLMLEGDEPHRSLS